MVVFGVFLLVAGIWWMRQPETPKEYFEVRCTTCHELRDAKVCEFPPETRPKIVDVMRHLHGADKVISEEETVIIKKFISEELLCK